MSGESVIGPGKAITMNPKSSYVHARRAFGMAGPIVVAAASLVAALPVSAAKNAERDGIGLLPLQEVAKLGGKRPTTKTKGTTSVTAVTTAATTFTIDPRRSLIDTDAAIQSAFPILFVLNTLAAGSPNSMIARQFYDQWMDVHNLSLIHI